jgi:hypothetical protein
MAEADERPVATSETSRTVANPLAKQSIQTLSATLKRPLFSPGRRPAPSAPVAPYEAPPPPPPAAEPAVTLVGTVLDGGGAQAILRSAGATADVHVRVGDEVSGWKVVDIAEQHLTLALNDRTFRVSLFPDKPSGQNPRKDPKRRAALGER